MNTIPSYLYDLRDKITAIKSITFLGTGPSQPMYERRGKSHRLNSSALIKYRGDSYLIDIGPTFDEKTQFDYLFVTHLHRDAFGGIDYVKEREFTFALPESLSKDIPSQKLWDKKIIKIYEKNKVGNMVVIPFRVKHDLLGGFPTYGYQFIFGDGKKVTYASDMYGIPERSQKYFNNIDVLIADGAGWKKNIVGHFGIFPFIDMVEKEGWKIGKIYFTQIGRPVPDYKEAQKELTVRYKNAHITYDGLNLII